MDGLQATSTDVEDYILLSEIYFIAHLQNNVALKNSTLNKMVPLAKSVERLQLLYLMIQDVEKVDVSHPAISDLVDVIYDINNEEYAEMKDWLRNWANVSYQRSYNKYNQHDQGKSSFG